MCGSVVCGVVGRRGEMCVCFFVWGDCGVGIVVREMSRCVVGDVYGGWLCVCAGGSCLTGCVACVVCAAVCGMCCVCGCVWCVWLGACV